MYMFLSEGYDQHIFLRDAVRCGLLVARLSVDGSEWFEVYG